MSGARKYNRNYANRLREKRKLAGRESQRVQALKRQARAGLYDHYEDVVARAKADRRGRVYRHLVGCDALGVACFRLVLIHAKYPARVDQFEVLEYRRSRWSSDVWCVSRWPKPVAMGAVLKRYAELLTVAGGVSGVGQ